MNGQVSSSNSFPETFHVGHSCNVNNLGFAQNNLVRTNSAVRDTQTVIDWMGQSSSRMITRNPNGPQELLGGHEWFSSMDPEGTGRRFQVRHSRPIISPFQENANIILIDGQVTNGQPILHGASFGSHCQNIDLNALQDNNKSDAHQDSGAGLSLHLFMPGGVEANQNLPPGISSAPVVISSGLGGYVLKENDQREGLSSDDMRVICKRRAPEDAPRLLHLGESSRSAQESGNSVWRAVTEQRNANGSLNISSPFIIPAGVSHPEQWEDRHGIGMMGAVSGMHHTSNGAGQAEWSQRNIRLSRAANPQDLQPPSMLLSGSTGNSYLQSPIQPTMFSPFHSFPDPSSVATFRVNGTPPVQMFMRVPNSVQNMQPSQWYDLTRSRPDVSLFPPVYAVNGTNTVQQEQSSRHITRNTLLVPETERGYVAQDPTAFYSVNGSSNYPQNIPSSSHNGTLSDVHFTSAPSWVTEYDITTQYRQRMSGVFSHSMSVSSGFVCGGQCGYCPVHLGASEAARDMELSIRGGNAIPFQVHLSSGLMINPERQAGGYPENPSALESIAIQRTSGLLSEVQNAVALFHRGGTLQREDVMVIEHTVLYGVPEEDGMNEDMHLDVDNMSYEELLNLGEDIGDVCTGLSHEAILANLRQRKYGSLTLGSPMEDEYCCICQEEYVDGDNLGILDCGHEFHFTCIIPWLVLKNSCPICKVKALAGCDGGD